MYLHPLRVFNHFRLAKKDCDIMFRIVYASHDVLFQRDPENLQYILAKAIRLNSWYIIDREK